MHITGSLAYKTRLAIFVVLISFTHVNGQTGIDAHMANTLQTTIDNLRAKYQVKGILAAAYIPGKGMWKSATGESYDGVPMDTTMLSAIGSITKTFVAAEILKMVEASQISLDDTIGALLPPITNVNGGIKVRQLLSHTSGMGEYLNANWRNAMNTDPYKIWHYGDAFKTFSVPATGAPGSAFQYVNSNYALLGMIIEAKKGDSLHRVLRNDLINPQHLDNMHMEIHEPYFNTIPHNWTTPTLNPALATDSWAIPHQALWTSTSAAGGYFSDAANLAEWGYRLYSGKVLSPTSLTEMMNCASIGSSGNYFDAYGLGVMRFPSGKHTYYGHGGNYVGYAASMLYYPQDSLCVAVLINQDCIATYEARTLMDVLINEVTRVKEAALQSSIVVYPNPASTQLTVSIPGNHNHTQVCVMDFMGRNVYSASTSAETISINTTSLNTGQYFIRLTIGDQTVSKSFFIEQY